MRLWRDLNRISSPGKLVPYYSGLVGCLLLRPLIQAPDDTGVVVGDHNLL